MATHGAPAAPSRILSTQNITCALSPSLPGPPLPVVCAVALPMDRDGVGCAAAAVAASPELPRGRSRGCEATEGAHRGRRQRHPGGNHKESQALSGE